MCQITFCQRELGRKRESGSKKNNLLIRLGKECIRLLEESRQDKFMAGTSAVVLLSRERGHRKPQKKPHVSYRLKRQARYLLHLHIHSTIKARLIRAARHLHNISFRQNKANGLLIVNLILPQEVTILHISRIILENLRFLIQICLPLIDFFIFAKITKCFKTNQFKNNLLLLGKYEATIKLKFLGIINHNVLSGCVEYDLKSSPLNITNFSYC